MDPKFQAFSWFLLACLLALAAQIFLYSPIDSPQSLHLPASLLLPPANNHLQSVIKLGQGFLIGPEDIVVDKQGVLYTATRDGWIKRLHKNGTWENWKMLRGHTLLGLATSNHDGAAILVCDAEKGLLKVGEDGVRVLAKKRFADDVIEASDGNAYFSVPSTKFGLEQWLMDVLEAKPNGQLLKYDPSSNITSLLLDGLAFPNGVALSKDQDFVVFCETWKFRCLKYWLEGEKKGETEVFVDNLPGAPDNINLAPDGSFWIAVLKITRDGMEFVHASKVSKYLIASFPRVLSLHVVSGLYERATAIKVDVHGKIIKRFDDPDGRVASFVTSVLEHEDHLYLGSLNNNFIGKLPLSG